MSMQSDAKNVLIIFKFIFYIIYRSIRSIIQLESDIIALIRVVTKANITNEVEFFHILARNRLDNSDICRECDFLLFSDHFGHFDELADQRWHIYSITDQYVYFCQIPSEEDLSILKNPKLSITFYEKAEKVARVNHITFASYMNNNMLKAKTIFLHSTPACGATLTAKMLQSADSSARSFIVLGEPPMLSSLSILMYSLSIEKLRELTKNVIRFSLCHYNGNQTVLIKTRSCCGKLVPYVHHSYPSIQHIFVTSKNPSDGIPRLISKTSTSIPIFRIICFFIRQAYPFCDFFTSWRRLERDTVVKIGPNDSVEFTLAHIMGATVNYQRTLKYYALDIIYFEDLMIDTASVLRPILYLCGLSELVIPECIEWKRQEDFEDLNDKTSCLNNVQKQRIKVLVELLQQEWNQ
ncbi:unnamed protein product [Auanema sp. JU1783]|nr:unnamed protein product [Auanema sp. JU1783]